MKSTKGMASTKKEIGVAPHGLSAAAKAKADEVLKIRRFKRLAEMDQSKRLYATLLSLKYRIEDYLSHDFYDQSYSFGEFLKEYTAILNLKRKELAQNLQIHETKFSRLVTNREDPNLEILLRIEAHSGDILQATLLYQLLSRKVMAHLKADTKMKKQQRKLVKNKVVI